MKFYDMDGNEVDLDTAEALLVDISRRRVALTEFGDVAHVSTVLLVVDHNWPLVGPPLIFETMTFMDGEGREYQRTSTRAAALAAHDQACAIVRDTLAQFEAAVASLGVD